MTKPENLTAADQLAHSTVRIECELNAGGTSTGTGFFFLMCEEGASGVPVIVTNKHVVRGSSKGWFHLTLQGADGGPAIGSHKRVELDQFDSRWIGHPDPDVDLCAMPIAPLLANGTNFFFRAFNEPIMPSSADIDDLIGLEDVVMVGYPNGLWDQVNNLPIFRKGILATDYTQDWNGRKEFLIDCACFPGSSGSPIMLFNIGHVQTRKGTSLGGNRIKLLGVLYAGPQHTIAGDVQIVTVPTQQKAIAVAGIPNNLGVAIKASQLRALDAEIRKLAGSPPT